jgi:hypothetical protein
MASLIDKSFYYAVQSQYFPARNLITAIQLSLFLILDDEVLLLCPGKVTGERTC